MAMWYYFSKAMKKQTSTEITPKFKLKNQLFTHFTSDPNNKCRVCLQTGTVYIYETKETDTIIEFLRIFTEMEINKNDNKPKLLCSTCYKFLKSMIEFRKLAKKSEEILNKPMKEETHDEYTIEEQHLSDSDPYTSNTLISGCPKIDHEKIKQENKVKTKSCPKVTCHICQKVVTQSYFKEHITMHDPDHKKYVCDICGKSFRLRCAYHNHSLRHSNGFPYKCSLCPYRGRYAELLRNHMRTHTADFRYLCTECPARFLFKSNLNSHMLKHKEPQYKCDTCKRAFHTKLNLERHFEAHHLGIKNHVCNICGKAFGFRNAMMKHQLRIHKREKYCFGRMPSYLQAEQKKLGSTILVNNIT